MKNKENEKIVENGVIVNKNHSGNYEHNMCIKTLIAIKKGGEIYKR